MNKRKVDNLAFAIHNLNNSSATVTLKADKGSFTAAARRLKRYQSLPYRMRPVLERVANYARTVMIPETFEREGPGWPGLSARTVMERVQQGYPGKHPILQRSGDLLDSLTDRAHPQHIEVIRTGREARIEIGSSSKKFLENQKGVKEMRLPARPMIPGTGRVRLEDRHRMALNEIVERGIKEVLNGRL